MIRSHSEQTHPNIPTGWLVLAVASLILAGVLAACLVVGRMPPFHNWITDPLFFRRCLIVHVELSLFVWFFSFLMFIYTQMPASDPSPRFDFAAIAVSAVGIICLVVSAGMPGSEPVLSNYLPVVDHPLFHFGMFAFGLGVVMALLQKRLFTASDDREERHIPAAAFSGLRTAGVAVIAAGVTIWVAWWVTPSHLPLEAYFERLFWGGGHVLQFANEAGMIVAWIILITAATGRAPFGRRTATFLFTLLITPVLISPMIAAGGTHDSIYRLFFTRLMQFGIFPVVLIILALCWRAVRREEVIARGPVWAFATSAVLTLVGFVLGAMIRGSNTLVPAHYHANIGAVTVAYMAVTYILLRPLGFRIQRLRLAAWQPVLFGIGQTVFAIGFGWAGSHGMGRKLYGQEQQVNQLGEYLGLTTMGIGGLLAIAGGVLFLLIVVKALLRGRRDAASRVRKWVVPASLGLK